MPAGPPPTGTTGRRTSPGTGFPDGTRSFVVSCFDPDAPTPAGYWHWTVVDLPAGTTSLPAGAGSPDGAALPSSAFQTRNDAGNRPGTRVPPRRPATDRTATSSRCTPWTSTRLDLGPDATPTTVAFTALFHTLARGTLTATWQR